MAKLKELGVLNPPNAPECLPLFPPLVPSTWGKVMSAATGALPTDPNVDDIGQFLVTDRDEESILSNSYLDCHSSTVDSSTMWGGNSGIAQKGNQNHEPLNTRTRMVTSLVTRNMTGITTGNVIDPKRVITDMVWIGLVDAPHDGEHSSNSKHERSCGYESPFSNHKAKQRCGASTSPLCGHKKSHTPDH